MTTGRTYRMSGLSQLAQPTAGVQQRSVCPGSLIKSTHTHPSTTNKFSACDVYLRQQSRSLEFDAPHHVRLDLLGEARRWSMVDGMGAVGTIAGILVWTKRAWVPTVK